MPLIGRRNTECSVFPAADAAQGTIIIATSVIPAVVLSLVLARAWVKSGIIARVQTIICMKKDCQTAESARCKSSKQQAADGSRRLLSAHRIAQRL
jgi:hypothetical protein